MASTADTASTASSRPRGIRIQQAVDDFSSNSTSTHSRGMSLQQVDDNSSIAISASQDHSIEDIQEENISVESDNVVDDVCSADESQVESSNNLNTWRKFDQIIESKLGCKI